MIEGKQYDDKYLSGVIACLKRNFPWMSEREDEDVVKWFEPLRRHEWNAPINADGLFEYGKVLVDHEEVVGYLGAISAERTICNKKVIVSNLTTWAVDKGARGAFMSQLDDLYLVPDIVIDLTPNRSSMLIEKNFYGAEQYEDRLYRILPVPYTGENQVSVKWINDERIEDEIIEKEYGDHKQFADIKLIQIDGESRCYIFYKIMHSNGEWIKILKVTNRELFSEHLHEISWQIFEKEIYTAEKSLVETFTDILVRSQNKQWICMECDGRYLGDEDIVRPGVIRIDAMRMVKMNIEIDKSTLDHLYTEYAVLL